MKNLIKPTFAAASFALFLSACTAGDKGSEQVADSVRIDTSQSGASSAGNEAGKSESYDSSAIDSSSTPGSVVRDTTLKNRSANGAADFKPNR